MKNVKLFLGALLLATGFAASADTILFTISGGPICTLEGPCLTSDDTFFDVATTTFTGAIQADGSIFVSDDIELSFAGGSQSITLSVIDQVLTADPGNFPVTPGVLPNGNWTGMFAYVTSTGLQGTIDLGYNTGQAFFIDNEEAAFNFSLNRDDDNGIINFFVTGNAELLAAPVPLPAGMWLLLSALGVTAGVRRRA